MMFAPLASVFQFGSLLEWASRAAVVLFALAQVRSAMQQEPLEDLKYRLQHKIRWTLSHPFRAIMRSYQRML